MDLCHLVSYEKAPASSVPSNAEDAAELLGLLRKKLQAPLLAPSFWSDHIISSRGSPPAAVSATATQLPAYSSSHSPAVTSRDGSPLEDSKPKTKSHWMKRWCSEMSTTTTTITTDRRQLPSLSPILCGGVEGPLGTSSHGQKRKFEDTPPSSSSHLPRPRPTKRARLATTPSTAVSAAASASIAADLAAALERAAEDDDVEHIWEAVKSCRAAQKPVDAYVGVVDTATAPLPQFKLAVYCMIARELDERRRQCVAVAMATTTACSTTGSAPVAGASVAMATKLAPLLPIFEEILNEESLERLSAAARSELLLLVDEGDGTGHRRGPAAAAAVLALDVLPPLKRCGQCQADIFNRRVDIGSTSLCLQCHGGDAALAGAAGSVRRLVTPVLVERFARSELQRMAEELRAVIDTKQKEELTIQLLSNKCRANGGNVGGIGMEDGSAPNSPTGAASATNVNLVSKAALELLTNAGVAPQNIVDLLNNNEDRDSVVQRTGFSNNYIMKLQRRVLRSSSDLQLRDPDIHRIAGVELHVLFNGDGHPLLIKKELCAALDMKGTTFSYWKKKSGVSELDTSRDFRLMDKCRTIFGGRSTYTLYTVESTLTILQKMETSRQKNSFTNLAPLKSVLRAYLNWGGSEGEEAVGAPYSPASQCSSSSARSSPQMASSPISAIMNHEHDYDNDN